MGRRRNRRPSLAASCLNRKHQPARFAERQKGPPRETHKVFCRTPFEMRRFLFIRLKNSTPRTRLILQEPLHPFPFL